MYRSKKMSFIASSKVNDSSLNGKISTRIQGGFHPLCVPFKLMFKRNVRFNVSVLLIVFVIFSILHIDLVKAAYKPLLLLTYEDIDDNHFFVNLTLSNSPEFSVFELPIAFESDTVRIVGYNKDSNTFTEITDGVKKADGFLDGKNGVIISPAVLDKNSWDGTVLENDDYPYISNEKGILSFAMYSLNPKPVFEDTNSLCTLCFERLKDGTPDIRIATELNTEYFDEIAPDGVVFAVAGTLVPVEWKYEGSVFEDNSLIVLPPYDEYEITGTEDADDYQIDVFDDENVIESGYIDGKTDGKNGKSGETSIEKTSNNTDKSDNVNMNKTANENNAIYFSDIDESYWAGEYINVLAGKGIINGYEDNTFKPENNITRAEFAALACSAKGYSVLDNNVVFNDSQSDMWYNRFLTSCYKNHIINGYPGGEFRPEDNITREDICVILYRMYFDNESEYTLSYYDSNNISEYAVKAVKVMTEKGILTGREDNIFAPKDFATRAETAKILYFCMNERTD